MCDTPLNASSTSYPFQAFWILLLCTKGCCVDPMVDFLSLSAKLSDLRLLRSSRKGGLTQREPSVPQYRPRAVTGAGHLTPILGRNAHVCASALPLITGAVENVPSSCAVGYASTHVVMLDAACSLAIVTKTLLTSNSEWHCGTHCSGSEDWV
ncbi:hypothetical protein FA13DRAFT_635082 [Coprinellus micaceus]|uniref:Uncharacterized protein n=1 Tax=Coprinellus micaceus TaxID=71717 RepID=A0A4Y7SAD4_COPMI|nr:hypothetical protein FA13DRAFT_635082 [Coprinellus micaceus]